MGIMHIPGHTQQKPREVSLEEIRAVMGDCRLCELCQTRTNIVFGVGNPHARVMFVGEAPGRNEDLQGEPFVGRAGENLNAILSLAGLTRDEIYIANVLKCRPPGNRVPLPEEAQACLPYLRAQFLLIKPKILVCLGSTAARNIIRSDIRITRERGQWTQRKGVWMLPTYHPSALLRDQTGAKKREAWEDLKALRAKELELGLRE